MVDLLDSLAADLREASLQVCGILHEHGHQAVLAGGAVRDALLGRPVSDVDIATSARPEEVEGLFEKTFPVGKQFGVVLVLLGERRFEVTTFRKEGKYLDGRHPSQVEFADIRQDAARRDFTINALYYDPRSKQVIDLVGGCQDLSARLIRSVGDPAERFREDKLRLLRAVRFSAQLDFQIERETWLALGRMAGQIEVVSRERIRVELIKLLTSAGAARGLRLLLESGLLEEILPEVAALEGVEQPPQFHPEGDVFVHTCLMFELAGQIPDPILAMGVLLHDVGKPPTFERADRIRFNGHAEVGAEMAETICRELRFSTRETRQIVSLVKDHLRFIHVHQMRESKLKRFLGQEDFSRHLELHRLDCLASHGDLTSYDFCRQKLEEYENEPLRPQPLLSGYDLIELGLKPGPLFSVLLEELEDLQLEGQISTREEALTWLRTRAADQLPSQGRKG